jgi:hypothetical protein
MDRLPLRFPLETFRRCQLCGHASQDIVEFTMWRECDDKDEPEPGSIIILCKGTACMKALNDHPRLYVEVPWGRGGPGQFMLLCGDCPSRKGSSCQHPNLKANGGQGLEVKMHHGMAVQVCFSDGTGTRHGWPSPAVWCVGNSDSVSVARLANVSVDDVRGSNRAR